MRAIDIKNNGVITEGKYTIASHILIYVDDCGNEYSTAFSEVREGYRLDSYQFDGKEYNFLGQVIDAIFLNKVNEITNLV